MNENKDDRGVTGLISGEVRFQDFWAYTLS